MTSIVNDERPASTAHILAKALTRVSQSATPPSARASVRAKKKATAYATTRIKQVWMPIGTRTLPTSPKACTTQLTADLAETRANTCQNFKFSKMKLEWKPKLIMIIYGRLLRCVQFQVNAEHP